MSKSDAAKRLLDVLASHDIGEMVDALKDKAAAAAFAKLLTTAMKAKDA